MFALVFATLTLTTAAPVPPDDANAKALKALQGKWKVVAAEENGEAGPLEDFDTHTVAIKGNVLAEIKGGKEQRRYEIKVDPSKSPAHLDLVKLDENGKPTRKVVYAIYKFDGDKLTICFGKGTPDDRPREFTTGSADLQPPKGKSMYTVERVKE